MPMMNRTDMSVVHALDERSQGRSTSSVSAPSGGQSYFDRWIKTWALLLVLVVLVVVAYLIVITSSLRSIDSNLGVARSAVVGADGNVVTLPDQIELANKNLTSIDAALKPIDGSADQIIGALQSINGKLGSIDGSLKSTDGSLKDTDNSLKGTGGSLVTTTGSLNNTAGTLESILRLATGIRTQLVDADDPPDRLGVTNIFQRVAVVNSILGPAQGDTRNVLGQLRSVNGSLNSICRSTAVTTINALGGNPTAPCRP
jgi:ABC-type transporter Mla subunit MlaD